MLFRSTFLFTDIEGSTKLLHEPGPAGYDDALPEHRRVLRGAFSRHGEVEVDACRNRNPPLEAASRTPPSGRSSEAKPPIPASSRWVRIELFVTALALR